MKRREFIMLLGGAAAWPFAARGQPAELPVIAFIDNGSAEGSADRVRAFRKGLNETGYDEGRSVAVEYHWLDGHLDDLPKLAADLVRRRVAGIATCCSPAIPIAAKAATSTIPIVFGIGADPVGLGLAASFNRPGGNATGLDIFTAEVIAKRLELLHQLAPKAVHIAVLYFSSSVLASPLLEEVQRAAQGIGLQIRAIGAETSVDIDAAFATFARERPDALFVAPNAFYTSHRVQIANLAARARIPASYGTRDTVAAGGLMSYGPDGADNYRQLGVYVGNVLNGAKPADLPILQPNKLELVINLRTARSLGLEVPPSLLAIADEVIE